METKILNIGRAITFKYATMGLILALAIIVGMTASFSNPFETLVEACTEMGEPLIVGLLGISAASYFIGGMASRRIILHRDNSGLVGVVSALSILFLGIISGGIYSLFAAAADDHSLSLSYAMDEHIFWPLVIIGLVGFIPTMVLGILMGKKIKKAGITYF